MQNPIPHADENRCIGSSHRESPDSTVYLFTVMTLANVCSFDSCPGQSSSTRSRFMELIFVAAILYVLWTSLEFGSSFNKKAPEPSDNEKLGKAVSEAIKAIKKEINPPPKDEKK